MSNLARAVMLIAALSTGASAYAADPAPTYVSFLNLPDPEVIMFDEGLDSDELIGSSVVSPLGVRIGIVTDLLVEEDGRIDKVALDPGSALGVGSPHVPVEIAQLRRTEAGPRTLALDISENELRNFPGYRLVGDRWEPVP